jgi:hypothetical protein
VRAAVGPVEARDGLRAGQVGPAKLSLRSQDGRFYVTANVYI